MSSFVVQSAAGEMSQDLDEGVRALLSGDLDRAQARFLSVLSADPANPLADSGLKNVVQARMLGHLDLPPMPEIVETKTGPGGIAELLAELAPFKPVAIPKTRAVRLSVPLATLMGSGLSPTDAFVLSRLAAGKLLVSDLAGLVGKPEAEIVPILERFLQKGVIAIV